MIRVRSRAVLLALGLLLAGCSVVPSTSDVRLGPVVDSGESSQFIRVIAAPPSPGASPEEIVRGFLEANASQQDNWGIARQYLTPKAAASWRPAASTRIYDGTAISLAGKGHEVAVEVKQVASLGADGTLSVLAQPRQRRLRYQVTEVPGPDGGAQLRIADPQKGILIREADLRRGYRLQRAYFMSNRTQTLVPDGRMVPVVGASLATRMVELVLAGPGPGLAPAVHSGAPQGLALSLGAVPVDNGVAVVDLGRQVLAASASQRRELAAQLTWTLTELPDVTSVRITVESTPLEVSGVPIVMDRAAWAQWGPDREITGVSGSALAVHYQADGRKLIRVSADGARAVVPHPVPARVGALAVSLDESEIALVAQSGRELSLVQQAPGSSSRILRTAEVTSVSYDVDNWLWYVDSGRVWRVGPGAQPQEVGLPADLPGEVIGLRLARDGARAALLVDNAVYVAAISVGAAAPGPEVRLVAAIPVAIGLAEVTGVSWQDAGTLAMLAASPAGAVQVQRLAVGDGHPTPSGSPEHPATVAAAPLVPTLVGTGNESLYAGVGLQWREMGSAQAVQYPG